MHVTRTDVSSTQVTLTVEAAEATLAPIKNQILEKLAKNVKLPGFRPGTAPIGLVEKNVDQTQLQTEFLDEAMTQLYAKATEQESIRPVTRPEVSIKKFVPFTELEFDVTTHVVGKISLPDYKKITAKKDAVNVTEKDIKGVVESLQKRMAERKAVERGAKTGDETTIDFKGVDSKGDPVSGAEGKDYPLLLGSNTFIPGFEDNLIGMKTGDEKTFTLTFPKEYGVKALANKDVRFTVTVKQVQELTEPKADDEFAAKVGPFKKLDELESDIKQQLLAEREKEAAHRQQDELVKKVVDKSSLDLPEPLIEQQIIYNMDEVRRNVTYRGQTMAEYLESEGMSEEEFKEKELKPQAIQQLKTSMVLGEIAERENLQVTPEELNVRLQLLKSQYNDPNMQAELDKPENQRDIASRMLSEKVVTLLAAASEK
jgi:trigger factor